MPFSTRRSSTRGTPLGLLGKSGSIACDSKSVRSYRVMPSLNQNRFNKSISSLQKTLLSNQRSLRSIFEMPPSAETSCALRLSWNRRIAATVGLNVSSWFHYTKPEFANSTPLQNAARLVTSRPRRSKSIDPPGRCATSTSHRDNRASIWEIDWAMNSSAPPKPRLDACISLPSSSVIMPVMELIISDLDAKRNWRPRRHLSRISINEFTT